MSASAMHVLWNQCRCQWTTTSVYFSSLSNEIWHPKAVHLLLSSIKKNNHLLHRSQISPLWHNKALSYLIHQPLQWRNFIKGDISCKKWLMVKGDAPSRCTITNRQRGCDAAGCHRSSECCITALMAPSLNSLMISCRRRQGRHVVIEQYTSSGCIEYGVCSLCLHGHPREALFTVQFVKKNNNPQCKTRKVKPQQKRAVKNSVHNNMCE